MNKSRSRAYNRDVSKRKALRKKRLAEEVYYNGKVYPYYDNLHQYSKNKVHCSCPLCRLKSKDSPKHSDLKKIEFAKDALREYEDESYEEIQEP